MADDFLPLFMGNAARAKLLKVFVLGQPSVFTLADAAKRAAMPVNAAGKELKVLAQWGVIKRMKFSIEIAGEKKVVAGKQEHESWGIDPSFEHAAALSRFVHEISPMDHGAVIPVLKRAGKVNTIILSGAFVGDLTRPADLIVAADALNETRLESAVKSLEPHYGREIRYAAFTTPEFRYRLTIRDRLLRETLDYPHLVLLDKDDLL